MASDRINAEVIRYAETQARKARVGLSRVKTVQREYQDLEKKLDIYEAILKAFKEIEGETI